MANNTNAQVVAFSNNRCRPLGDLFHSAYMSAKVFVELWTAQGLGPLIPSTADLIVDGSPADGRPPMSNFDANIVFAQATSIINLYEGSVQSIANDGSKQNLNQLAAIVVNGTSIF